MAIREIIRMGHPTLRKVAEPVPEDFIGTPEFHTLVEDMRDTLAASGGIGLAAPQIDVSLQIAVVEVDELPSRYGTIPPIPFSVYVNPKITVLDEVTEGYWEGCLSVPGMRGFVERPQHIRVDYLDANGEPGSYEALGFQATLFQHEFDHLFGVLYVDKLKDPTLFAYEEEFDEFGLPEVESQS